jgi:hypothetical protein
MPINRNSTLYKVSRRTYDRQQGEIQARKRYGQVNARKVNRTFRVRLCVTARRCLRIQVNLPTVPIHSSHPRSRSTYGTKSNSHQSHREEELDWRERKQSSEENYEALVSSVFAETYQSDRLLPTKFFLAHPTTLWCCCYGMRI